MSTFSSLRHARTSITLVLLFLFGTAWSTLARGQEPILATFDPAETDVFGSFGPSTERVGAVASESGFIYVAGTTTGSVTGGVPASNDDDVFLRKYDAAGNVIWTREFGSPDQELVFGAWAGSGFVYVVGRTEGEIYADPADNDVGEDGFVIKFSDDGVEQWRRQIFSVNDPGDPSPKFGLETATGVWADAGGTVYVVGRMNGSFGPGLQQGRDDGFIRAYDADGNLLWLDQFGANPYIPDPALPDDFVFPNEMASGVWGDGSNVYVVGQTDGDLTNPMGGPSMGETDGYIRKYAAGGALLWTDQFGTTAADTAAGVSGDATGVYVVGGTDGQLDADSPSGGTDAFVRKYDLSGSANVLWTRQFGTMGTDAVASITGEVRNIYVSADVLGVYVTGSTDGQLGLDPTQGGIDTFTRQYASDGTEGWTRQLSSPGDDIPGGIVAAPSGVFVGLHVVEISDGFVQQYAALDGADGWMAQISGVSNMGQGDNGRGVVLDPSGNTYVIGATGHGALPGQIGLGNRDAFIRKYDASRNLLWTDQFGTSSFDDARAVAVDETGSRVYVVGQVGGGAALPGEMSVGGQDAFVRAYGADGTHLWTDQFGTAGMDFGFAVSVASGRVYVGGQIRGGAALPGETSAGENDAYVRAYDAITGAPVWTDQFGTPGIDDVRGVVVDAGGVYVSGFTQSSGNSAMPSADSTETTFGDWDAFLRRYDLNGNEQWTRQFGTAGFDTSTGLASDGSGVYVSGITNMVMPSADSAESWAGGFDYFVRRYDPSGVEQWTRQFGSDRGELDPIVATGAGGIYVTGSTNGTLPGQPPTLGGPWDAFVRSYNPDGAALWTIQIPSLDSEFGTGVAVTPPGVLPVVPYVYVAGYDNNFFAGGDVFVGRMFLHDADGDGVDDDTVQTSPGNFDDGDMTTGAITDDAGLPVFVEDHGNPAEGVIAWVGPGPPGAKAEFNVCGGFKVKVSAGNGVWNQAEFSCGSVKIRVVTGDAELSIGDGTVTLAIGPSTLTRVTENTDGTTSVENLTSGGSGDLSFSYENADGDQVTVNVPEEGAASVETGAGGTIVENIGDTDLPTEVDGQSTPPIPPGGGLGAVLDGFQAPVVNDGMLNEAQGGKAVPLKWTLTKTDGTPIDDLIEGDVIISISSYWDEAACEVAGNEIAEIDTVGSTFNNQGNGEYHLNWKTPSGYTGCSMMTLTIPKWSIVKTTLFNFK